MLENPVDRAFLCRVEGILMHCLLSPILEVRRLIFVNTVCVFAKIVALRLRTYSRYIEESVL